MSAQARFPADSVRAAGTPALYVRRGDSGAEVTFRFCRDCGSTVWWTLGDVPGFVAVAMGAFADPGFPAPTVSVYETHKHRWARIDGDVERLE